MRIPVLSPPIKLHLVATFRSGSDQLMSRQPILSVVLMSPSLARDNSHWAIRQFEEFTTCETGRDSVKALWRSLLSRGPQKEASRYVIGTGGFLPPSMQWARGLY